MAVIIKWYKNLSLKKTFILLSFASIVVTVLLSFVAMSTLNNIRTDYYASLGYEENYVSSEYDEPTVEVVILKTESDDVFGMLLLLLILASPLLVFLVVVSIMSFLLYNTKLKEPIKQLSDGMDNIARKNLDFKLDYKSYDELGQLCSSFEVMRSELLENNLKMWRDIEERQNLNKAFSHDIRTPITIIKGHIQVLSIAMEKNQVSEQQIRQTLQLSMSNLSKIENYVQTMEEASSLQDIQPNYRQEKLAHLLSQIHLDFEVMKGSKTIRIIEEFEDMNQLVHIDWKLTMRILENLVSNGLRYCTSEVVIVCSHNGDLLRFTVADDGAGFSEEAKNKAFMPFYTTDYNNRKGLGLYISQMLASRMFGSISIDTAYVGGRVILEIPQHET